MKKIIYFVFSMLFVMVACSSNQETGSDNEHQKNFDNLTDSGMPIVKENITLDIFAGQAPATNEDWNDVLIWNEYEKMTNIDVNWEMVPHEGLAERRNLSLSGDLPDAYHSAVIPATDLYKYGNQGTFIRLNDLIDEHAPNFKKILEE